MPALKRTLPLSLVVTVGNLLLGGLPSLVWHVWIVFNLHVPVLWDELGWPVQLLPPASHWLSAVVCNTGLVLLFGIAHSVSAQAGFYAFLRSVLPLQYQRPVYMMLTGLFLTVMMMAWQPLGSHMTGSPVAWDVRPSLALTDSQAWILQLLVSFLCMLPAQIALSKHGLVHFIGLSWPFMSEERLKETQFRPGALLQTGIYGVVRHPIYLSTLSFVFTSIVMSYDRLLLGALLAAYLLAGVHYEEKKLVSIYGPSYELYKKHVSAVFPWIFIRDLVFASGKRSRELHVRR